MPYKKHPEFDPPKSETSSIWRYMDLAKFLSILNSNSLFFPSVATLSEFDPFEGLYTNANLQIEKISFDELPQQFINRSGIKNEKIFESFVEAQVASRKAVKKHREITFVNSWHIKEYESAAMWNQYLSNHEGVAIQSTFQRLKKCFNEYKESNIYIGKIKYIDYQFEAIPQGNMLSPFMYKRKSFEYEDELRALIWLPEFEENKGSLNGNKYLDKPGIYVPIDVNTLIENIFVSPNAPTWITELISSLTKKMGFDKKVIQSNLASEPLY